MSVRNHKYYNKGIQKFDPDKKKVRKKDKEPKVSITLVSTAYQCLTIKQLKMSCF